MYFEPTASFVAHGVRSVKRNAMNTFEAILTSHDTPHVFRTYCKHLTTSGNVEASGAFLCTQFGAGKKQLTVVLVGARATGAQIPDILQKLHLLTQPSSPASKDVQQTNDNKSLYPLLGNVPNYSTHVSPLSISDNKLVAVFQCEVNVSQEKQWPIIANTMCGPKNAQFLLFMDTPATSREHVLDVAMKAAEASFAPEVAKSLKTKNVIVRLAKSSVQIDLFDLLTSRPRNRAITCGLLKLDTTNDVLTQVDATASDECPLIYEGGVLWEILCLMDV